MAKKLSVFLLILLLFSIAPLMFRAIESVNAVSNQNRFFDQKMYLTNQSSDVKPFFNLTYLKPTGTLNQTLSVKTGNGESNVLVGGWITPKGFPIQQFFFGVGYNFLFSIWANKTSSTTAEGHLFARLGICNNNNENQTSELNVIDELHQSAPIPTDTFQNLLWQEKTFFQTMTLNSNQRLFINLYVHANGTGTWYISFFSAKCPSYFLDPTETRYMTNYFYDGVSNLQGYNLSTTNSVYSTSQSKINTTYYYGACYVGIRVWHNATEITSGTPVAQVQVYDGDSYVTYNNTWSCPSTSLQSTEYVNVSVYVKFGNYWYQLGLAAFRTEILGAQSLDVSTWNVFYVLSLTGDVPRHRTTVSITFGSATYNSRVENFAWTVFTGGGQYNLFGTISFNQAVNGYPRFQLNLFGFNALSFQVLGSLLLQPFTLIYLFGTSLLNVQTVGNLRLLASGGLINLFGKIMLNFFTDMSGTELSWSNEMIFAWVIVLLFILVPGLLLLFLLFGRRK